MESKELNEILNKTRRTPNISLTPEQVEELVTSLEELEKLKNLMGMPIQDIMKRLKILEEIRNYFKVIDWGEGFQYRYELIYLESYKFIINKEQYIKWSKLLNEKNEYFYNKGVIR